MSTLACLAEHHARIVPCLGFHGKLLSSTKLVQLIYAPSHDTCALFRLHHAFRPTLTHAERAVLIPTTICVASCVQALRTQADGSTEKRQELRYATRRVGSNGSATGRVCLVGEQVGDGVPGSVLSPLEQTPGELLCWSLLRWFTLRSKGPGFWQAHLHCHRMSDPPPCESLTLSNLRPTLSQLSSTARSICALGCTLYRSPRVTLSRPLRACERDPFTANTSM